MFGRDVQQKAQQETTQYIHRQGSQRKCFAGESFQIFSDGISGYRAQRTGQSDRGNDKDLVHRVSVVRVILKCRGSVDGFPDSDFFLLNPVYLP